MACKSATCCSASATRSSRRAKSFSPHGKISSSPRRDPDNIKGLLIKGPNRHKLLPFPVLCRMASRELHNVLTFTSNGDQIKFRDMAKVISALSADAAEIVAAGIVAATARKVQAIADPKGRADIIITTCKKLIKDAKIPFKSDSDLAKKMASLT